MTQVIIKDAPFAHSLNVGKRVEVIFSTYDIESNKMDGELGCIGYVSDIHINTVDVTRLNDGFESRLPTGMDITINVTEFGDSNAPDNI